MKNIDFTLNSLGYDYARRIFITKYFEYKLGLYSHYLIFDGKI